MALHVVVLAGGSGTRLWPLSRAGTPKHLLPLGPGGRSLLRATVERVLPLGATVWVVTIAAQAERCAEELAAAGGDRRRVVAEPAARGTGPALGIAMAAVRAEDPDAVVCSVHADHQVGDDAAYAVALWAAAGWATAEERLATVGLRPTRPATGFGYVALGEPLPAAAWRPPVAGPGRAGDGLQAYRADGFVEKPSLETARRFLDGGRHLWNTGLFAWRAGLFLAELAAAAPAVASGCAAVAAARARGDEAEAATLYDALPVAAVEPLVLERTRRLTVVAASFAWSDLGTWLDLAVVGRSRGEGDAAGNVASGDTLLVGARDCLVESRGGRLLAVVGAEGLVVVDTGDAVLVLPAEAAQAVKDAVDELRRRGRAELL